MTFLFSEGVARLQRNVNAKETLKEFTNRTERIISYVG